MDKLYNSSTGGPDNYALYDNTVNTSLNNFNCSQLTMEFKLASNSPNILFAVAMMVAQGYNLVVFHYWRNKEPFLLLHVWLAVLSLLYASIGLLTPLTRILPWNEMHSTHAIKLVTCSFFILQAISILMLLAISVDRWLSVEFAIRYRNQMSRRILKRVVIGTFVAGLLLR